jgi:hypothetical protein
MKRIVLVLGLALTAAAACPGDEDPTGTNGSITGTYALQSVNGDPLPAQWVDGPNTLTITAGSLTMNANLSFAWSETADGITESLTGTCVLTTSPSTYTCSPQNGDEPGIVAFSGNVATLTTPGGTAASTENRIYAKN